MLDEATAIEENVINEVIIVEAPKIDVIHEYAQAHKADFEIPVKATAEVITTETKEIVEEKVKTKPEVVSEDFAVAKESTRWIW